MLAIEISGGDELRALKARLNAAARVSGDRSLAGLLQRHLRAEMQPARDAVKRGVLSTPSAGSRHTGLRRRIAGKVQARIRTVGPGATVSIRIASEQMPSGQKSLPARLDGTGRWRHPVYGNQKNWVSQRAHPYFARSIEPTVPQWQDAVARAMSETAAVITAG